MTQKLKNLERVVREPVNLVKSTFNLKNDLSDNSLESPLSLLENSEPESHANSTEIIKTVHLNKPLIIEPDFTNISRVLEGEKTLISTPTQTNNNQIIHSGFKPDKIPQINQTTPRNLKSILTSNDMVNIPSIYIQEAQKYYEQGLYEKAISECQQAISLQVDLVLANIIIGNSYQKVGGIKEAEINYQAALKIEPNNASIYRLLGNLYAEYKSWHSALSCYQKAVEIEPKIADNYRQLAEIWAELGESKEAIDCWYQAYSLEPKKVTANDHLNLGNKLYGEGEISRAVSCYENSLKLNPNLGTVNYNLSVALKCLGRLDEAVIYQHKAEEIWAAQNQNQNKNNCKVDMNSRISAKLEIKHQNGHQLSPKEVTKEIWPQENQNRQNGHQPSVAEIKHQNGHQLSAKEVTKEIWSQENQNWHNGHQPSAAEIKHQNGHQLSAKEVTKEIWSQENQNQRNFKVDINSHISAQQQNGYQPNPVEIKGESNQPRQLNQIVPNQIKYSQKAQIQEILKQANTYYLEGLFSEAIATCEAAIKVQENPEAYQIMGKANHRKNQVDNAINCYRQALKLNPNDSGSNYEMGNILALLPGKLEEAITYYRKALEIEPYLTEAYYSLANILVNQNQLEKVVILYEKLIEIQPNLWKPHHNLGDILIKQEKFSEAISAYGHAIKLNPNSSVSYFKLADILAKVGELSEAINAYHKVIAIDPDFVDAYHYLGDTLRNKGEKEEAIKVYRKAVEIRPQLWEVHHKLGSLFQETEELEAAVSAYRKSIELNSDFCWSYNSLGDVLVKLEKWSEAKSVYHQAIELNPAFPWSYNNLGDVLVKLEKWSEAASAYGRAIELNPDFPWNYYKLADVLVKLEDWEGAIAHYKKAIELDPNFARSYYNLAEICLQLEYWDQAVEAYRQLMQIQPDFSAQVEEKLNQALHQQVKGKLEQALSYYRQAIENDPTDVESYEKALEIKPDDAELYLGLGNAFVAKGEEKKAVIAFQKAIVINPDLDRAHYQLSTMYQELDSQWHNYYEKGNKLQLEGQLEKAVIAYYQAILRNPHHSWSYHNLGDTHLKLGNWEEATIAYKKAIRLNPDYFWSNYNLGVAYSNSEQWHLAVQLYLKSIKLNPGLNLPYLTLKETLNKQWYSTIQKADILLKQGDRKSANNIYKKAIQEYQAFLPIEYFNFPKEIPTEPSILLVVDDFLPQCLRYRVHQKIEHLEAAGFSVKFIPQTEIQKAKNIIHFCHVVIFYRVPAFPEIIETIKYAKAIKKVVFYEIDDLIFDPEEYPDSFDSYAGQITHDEYEGLCRGTILFEEAMALFDYGITSTPALAQEMEKIISTKTIFIHRNALDSHNSEFLKVGIPKIKRDYISIFYGTGTKAHNSDFNELAAPAIAQILENYPQIRLTVVGYLTLPEVLLSYQDRIDQVEVIRDIRVYWDFLQQADINIAVLHSTKVNNCKSELKWFEAALLGVPSVVSATQTYLEVVEHGVDGLIAKTTEEWYENLERLVTNEQLRSSLAEAAYQKTVKNYSVPVMAKNIQQIIMTGIEQEIEKGNLVRRCSTKQKLLIVNVFYPPQSIGGGTRVVRDHVDIFMEKYRDKYEVQVFTSDNDNSVPYQITEYTYKNVHVTKVSTPMQEGMDWQYKNPEMYDIFAQYLEFNQPDLIHFHCVQRLTASVLEAAEELLSSCDDFKKQKVVEVNYVLKEKRFAKSINQAFDLIIANHVIEHIPDTISFLQEISEILSKNGFLFLAVPHKEYTFDKLRTTTSLTEIIRNYDENLNERNLYQLLDCIYFRRPINSGGDVWNGNFKHLLEKKPFKTVKDALEFAKTMINENKYTGIHCNVFTYQSFLDICNELLISNLIDLKLVSSQDVLKPYNEFFVILKKY